MNQEEIQQAAREEAWVPKADRVKISTKNKRIDPTMTQKEETYQVVLNILKNITFYKAFHASTDVFTKVIINYFLSIHKSVPKALPFGLHTIKDDGVLSRMKFVKIGEDVQEYGKAIPNTMLTNAIKQSEAYKAFIDYFTGLVPPKKTRGTDVALELGKSISKTDAEIADETRRCPLTLMRLIKTLPSKPHKLKGIQVMIAEEQFDADIKKAMKASKPAWKLPKHYNSLEVQVKELVLHQSNDKEKGDYDRSIDIEETNDERTDSDNGDQAMIDMEKNVAEKTEKEQGDEEHAEEAQDDDNQDEKDQADDDIIGTLVTMSQKEKLEIPDLYQKLSKECLRWKKKLKSSNRLIILHQF
ncbi:hypothetical protein Tco_0957611 [Tanacetum coccineum]